MSNLVLPRIASRRDMVYRILTVAGFSFWFLIGVPFALHRESYVWLASAARDNLDHVLGLITATWRPLAQTVIWLGFVALNPHIFPTSTFRQALLQGSIYVMFVAAWMIIYSAARERKALAIISLIAGGVFFSGYVSLFHIHGLFYLAVLVMLAIMLRLYTSGNLESKEWMAVTLAMVLAFWHPFATAIFLGFYFGRYMSRFTELERSEHVKSWAILMAGAATVLILLATSPRTQQTFNSLGFIATYRTNEVNIIASLVSLALALITVASARIGVRMKLALSLVVAVAGAFFLVLDIPVLLLWILVVFCKLLHLRHWELVVPLVVATMLPFGAGIGAPVYGLYAIVLAVFATPWGWVKAEEMLSSLNANYVALFLVGILLIAIGVRSGFSVPVVSRYARPLLVERERTYQLEHVLSWLAESEYCGRDIAFAERSPDPVDSIEDALIRPYRPPAVLAHTALFWNTVLRCKEDTTSLDSGSVVTITFGGQQLNDAAMIFELPSANAGSAIAWIHRS